MKIFQSNAAFQPITIVLETRDEAKAFADMVVAEYWPNEKARDMAKKFVYYIHHEAKL
jgi:hypothetical protein